MQTQIVEILRNSGWQKKTWDGDEIFLKIFGNAFVTINVLVKQLLAGHAIDITGGWGRIDFNTVLQEVMADENSYPLEYKKFRLKTNKLDEAMTFVAESAAQLEQLAKDFDFDKKLKELIASRPDRPSLPQVFHLAGLAYSGNVNELDDYDRTFAKGHRLNFVPMISHDYIKRALKVGHRAGGESLTKGAEPENVIPGE